MDSSLNINFVKDRPSKLAVRVNTIRACTIIAFRVICYYLYQAIKCAIRDLEAEYAKCAAEWSIESVENENYLIMISVV